MINTIVISGKAGHGKTTLANLIKEELENQNFRVMKIAFADYLKFIAKKYYGWNGEKDEKGRTLLQYLGTDVVRKNDENFWADIVSRLTRALNSEFDYFIIDDARFPNEVNAFPAENTILIKVIRPNYCSLTSEQQSHASETALDSYIPNYEVINDTIEELKESATAIIEEIRNEY